MLHMVYVLTDKDSTGVGITGGFDERMLKYNTHNPSYSVFRTYRCSKEDACRVESVVKTAFVSKRTTNRSREWFSVHPTAVTGLVEAILGRTGDVNCGDTSKVLHSIRVTETAFGVLNFIRENQSPKDDESRDVLLAARDDAARLFGSTFGLGFPECDLPEGVACRVDLAPDWRYAKEDTDENCALIQKAVKGGLYDGVGGLDHKVDYYTTVPLSSGSLCAVQTATVSMPYRSGDDDEHLPDEVYERADALGLVVSRHDDWSWHGPNELFGRKTGTDLLVYTRKSILQTILNDFSSSFRKWIVENGNAIISGAQAPGVDRCGISKCVHDVSTDGVFPLRVYNSTDLSDEYINKYRSDCMCGYQHAFEREYEALFTAWKGKDNVW